MPTLDFSTADIVDIELTNLSQVALSICKDALLPGRGPTETPTARSLVGDLGGRLSDFRSIYLAPNSALRRWIDTEGILTATLVTEAGVGDITDTVPESIASITPSLSPPGSPSDGQVWNKQGNLFYWDNNRSKWLGLSDVVLTAGVDFDNVTNRALDITPTIGSNQVPFVFNRNMVLVSAEVRTEGSSSWALETRDSSNNSVIASLAATGTSTSSTSLNDNHDAGTSFYIYANGSGVKVPQVMLYFKERGQ